MNAERFLLKGVSDPSWVRAQQFLERLSAFRPARILPIGSWRRTGDELELIRELPEHVTLHTWLERETRLPFLECGRVLGELAEALAAAHAAGFAHGALGTKAVLWSDVHVQVDGFGRAQLRALLAGEPGAPDFAADLRAFGSIGYQVVTGRIHQPGAPPPNALREHVPPGLASLILRCLDERATRRPSAADLLRFTSGLVTPPTHWRAPMLVRQAAWLLETEAPPWNRAAERVDRALQLDGRCPGANALQVQLSVERFLLGFSARAIAVHEFESLSDYERARIDALRELLAPDGASIEAASRAAELAGGDYQAWLTLARLHVKRGEAQAAVTCALRARELAPFAASTHHTLARAQLSRGDTSAALDACERALELGAHWPTLHLRGEIHARAGRVEAAQRDFALAASLHPSARPV